MSNELEVAEELENKFYRLHFNIQRSIRYHQRRRAWFEEINKVATGFGALFGTVTIYTVLESHPQIAMGFAAVVTALSTLDLVIGSTGMARLHHDLAKDFMVLDGEIRTLKRKTEAEFHRLWKRRLAIEANEPPVKVILNRLCYNEQLRAEGNHPREAFFKIGFYARHLAHVVDIGADKLPKMQS